MEKWIDCTVEEIAAPIKNALVGGPFGSNLVSTDYVKNGIPVIRGQNMGFGRWVGGQFVFVTEAKAESLNANIGKPNDVVFTQRGTLGQVALIPKKPFERYVISQSQMKLTVDDDKADAAFVYYLFKSETQQRYIRQNTIQTGVPHTNLGILRRTLIKLPTITEQRRIAEILSTLDEKIELNLQMNATLEKIAQAIFKHWFVDFQFPGFDGELVDGLPKDWRKEKINALAKAVQYGFTQSSTSHPTHSKFLRITDIQGGAVDWSHVPYCVANEPEFKKYRIVDHDIFIARTGASTGENIYVTDSPDAVFASYLIRVQFENPHLALYVGKFLRRDQYFDYVASILGGSAQPNANAQELTNITISVPPNHILEKYFGIVHDLNGRKIVNEQQNQCLAQIRDRLLPGLMTGKIRVGE